MQLGLALLPLGAALALIASGRVSVAHAGLIGAGLALALAVYVSGVPAAGDAALRGLWVAWQAISIILAGLIFQRTALAAAPGVFQAKAGGDDRAQAFAAVFLLGVFVESASGFGLGAVAAAAALPATGVQGARRAALALLTLALVPWGALAIGTTIAAGLTGIPVATLGEGSAVWSVPVLLAALILFWLWAPRASGGRMAVEVLWLAALLALLWLVNVMGAVDVAGVVAAGALFALRFAIDRSQGRSGMTAAPFALFALLIVALRLTPGVTPFLSDLIALRPWADLPDFPPLAHASFWLLATAFAYAAAKGLPAARIGAETVAALKAAKTPVLVTAGFVVLGEAMARSGATEIIATSLTGGLGPAAAYGGPVFAALAGWLTGSNAAAHGMLVDLQAAIGAAAGQNPEGAVVAQNVVASAYTMLSPMRIALAAAALGLLDQEGKIARLLLPFAAAALGVGWLQTALG